LETKNILTPQNTILIVDDDNNVLEVLNARLSSQGFRVLQAPGANEALDIIKKESIDLMISDVKMPGMGGLDLFTIVRSQTPNLPVIFLTAYGTIAEAVRAVKAGAVDYLPKPFDGRDLIKKINQVLGKKRSANKKIIIPTHIDQDFYWGNSPVMKDLYKLVKRVAVSHVNVLILGDSGVGKGLVASLIHHLGPRKAHPFMAIDCGSTPAGLMESELFGHVKGSFTHAVHDKKGLIEVADQGTLFLDEIGNISPDMQVKLLRFLEERKIRKIGGIHEIPVDCRVISATNSDLHESIHESNFREDLYYRLRVITIQMPTLKERKEDIPHLAKYFATRYCEIHGVDMIHFPDKTIKWLCAYPWPGNVRELKNAIEAGIVLCRDGVLNHSDLQLNDITNIPHPDAYIQNNSFSLEDNERSTIIRALRQTGGVQKKAADLLGISRRAIHYKIKKYDIDIVNI
jgi:DNA-binding NtrC family response regulator